MLKDNVVKAINEQIQKEFYSSYLYLAMAAQFDATNLPGFASWMKAQAREEWGHGMKLYEYLNDQGARVVLEAIEKPTTEFGEPVKVFEEVLKHEQFVTASINKLYELSLQEKDYASQVMLHWFITEQVEEEKTASEILEQLKAIGDRPHLLLMLDGKLGARQ